MTDETFPGLEVAQFMRALLANRVKFPFAYLTREMLQTWMTRKATLIFFIVLRCFLIRFEDRTATITWNSWVVFNMITQFLLPFNCLVTHATWKKSFQFRINLTFRVLAERRKKYDNNFKLFSLIINNLLFNYSRGLIVEPLHMPIARKWVAEHFCTYPAGYSTILKSFAGAGCLELILTRCGRNSVV